MTRTPPSEPAAERSWVARHRVALGLAGAVAAGGMAVLWSVVVPERAETTAGWRSAAIRYGHPATWALLSLLGVLVAAGAPRRLRSVVGAMSIASYAAFLAAMVL